MHHRPAGPPLSARLHAALLHCGYLLRRVTGRHAPRLLLGTVLTTGVTALVLAVPVLSGAGETTTPVALDSSSSTSARLSSSPGTFSSSAGSTTRSREKSPVRMGVDGVPRAATGSSAKPASPKAPAPAAAPGTRTTAAGSPSSPAEEASAGSSVTQAPRSSTAASVPRATGGGTPPPAPAPPPAPVPPPAPDLPAPAGPAAQESPAWEPAPAAAAPQPGLEGEVLSLVNEQRAAAGCDAVRADAALAAVARAHSADMRNRNFFGHTNPDGLSPFDRARKAGVTYARAENIARGQADAAAVMQGWMNSPGHRQNILDCTLRTLGVGVAAGPGGPWWTQLFGG